MIDRQTIDRIMNAADIVEVVSDFVALKKRGTSYKGLCPFHDDTTPSFSVSPVKGVYKCFACGEAGNAVNFIMKHEQMTYPEALRWLANKYHIEIRERELTTEEQQAESERESMFIVNEWVAQYFQGLLSDTDEGRTYGMQYLRSRGIRDDIIKKFRIGYDLQKRDALPFMAKTRGYREEFLLKTGVCYQKDNGGLVDRFSGRVIFPWLGISGKVVAFGGRLLDSRTKGVAQKYVNSPDSEIYHKERELYGIFQAKKAIAKEDCVYMVEGYTDVIAMHQCGIENVVANSGTALSYYQIQMLHRFTSNIVLLYDGDEAGIHAAMRGTDMLLSEGMNVKVLLLPDGDDPDSFARKHTATELRNYIDAHKTDFIEFKISQTLRGVTDPIKRSEAVNSIVKSISVIKDQILRATYVKECSNRTGVDEQTIVSQMNRMIYANRENERTKEYNKTPNPTFPEGKEYIDSSIDKTNHALPSGRVGERASVPSIETLLIQTVIRHGDEVIIRDVEDETTGERITLNVAQYVSYDLSLDDLHFSQPLYEQILSEAVEHSGDPEFHAEEFFTHHPDINVSSLAVRLATDDVKLSESLQVKTGESELYKQVTHLVLDFRMDWVEEKLKALRVQLAHASGNPEQMMSLLTHIKKLQDMRNLLAKRLGYGILSKHGK